MADETPLFDLLLRGGMVVTPDVTDHLDVAVTDGRIAALLAPGSGGSAKQVIDVTGLTVLPGGIDPHTHLWEPGLVARDDFRDATRAAACGGMTTVIDHPLTLPEVTTLEIFEEKRMLGERTSYVDFALHGGITRDNIGELEPMWRAGATSFKAFMCESGSVIEHMPWDELEAVLTAVRGFGGIVMVHAEDQSLLDANEAALHEARRTDHLSLSEWRTPDTETSAVSAYAEMCVRQEARGVIVHTSAGESVSIARDARARGAGLAIETCPHYLYFTEDDLVALGPQVKAQPPVRAADHVEALWRGLESGDVAMVGSDHGPVEWDRKRAGLENIWLAQGGMPSVETMVSVLLDGVAAGRLSMPRLADAMATYAARWYGLYPRKGAIAVGSDADFMIVDPAERWTVRASDLTSDCGWTPLEGRELTGRVIYTIARGVVIAERGRLTSAASPGFGSFIPASH